MSDIEHQREGDALIVWTYPANGQRFTYRFDADSLELEKKTKTRQVATSDETTSLVAPNVTPAVRDYLHEHGFDY